MGRAHVLEQTLVNLLLNAIDATPAGGSIIIGARRWAYEPGQSLPKRASDPGYARFPRTSERRPARVEFAAGQPGALLFVADSGSGVAPEDREKVFEPFYTTKEPGRHRRAIRARNGRCSLGGWGAGRGRGVQDVLSHRRSAMKKVLVVDDEPGLRQSLGLLLTDAGYVVTAEQNGRRALERATADAFDLVLCDVRMPEMDGLTFLRNYRQRGGSALVIVMSAYGGEDAAIAAMKEGAYDYLPKPFRPDEVVLTLKKAEERERLRQEVAGLKAQLATGPAERGLIVESAAMRQALDLVTRVAEHNTTVLITGESGTGKEVIARAIHRASPRAGKAFVGINCAAIPEALLESELFGHVRGAFTGASSDKTGLFEAANGGTILLDEIGELPLGLQAKLLRVLQENEIRRVGDQKTRRVDARVLAATARDLEAEVRGGRFREDLFYRIHVVVIELPPLREREDDIAPLSRHFAGRLAERLGRPLSVSDDAIAWLAQQPWPGNVRELENAIERAAVLNQKAVLERGDFSAVPPRHDVQRGSGGEDAGDGTLRSVVEVAERLAIIDALKATDGNRRAAAQRLGVSLRTLFYKIDRYGIT